MNYTRGEASGLLALALGAPGAKLWLCGWSAHEIQCGVGCQHPQNNLWACGQAAPGATDWNGAGVKNYPTLTEAIAATAANLADPKYPAYQRMVHDIQQGKTDSPNIRAGLSTWCGSTCYSQDGGSFIATGQAHQADQFDDSGGGGVSPEVSTLQTCVYGLPGSCPTDYTCWPIGSSGRPLCNAAGAPFWAPSRCFPPGTDFTQQCDNGSGQVASGFGGATPGGQQAPFGINVLGWSGQRIVKWLLGLGLIIFSVVLIGGILLEKAEGNPAVQGATKLVAAAGA